ncbi:hypothetical protein GYMLUDRAFT_254435 [Collybiopsis luxurians FD-317 M1]|nr:hypothetical protein GYMLUDRAFT_254435 [Collybiopsis luxurians FD-317 M1]
MFLSNHFSLEHRPPVPTLQPQQSNIPRINSFLGVSPENYVVSMSLRDLNDGREMPANTNAYVTANCIRGVRKVTSNDWRTYAISCNPDIVFSLSDTPFTSPPYSQKRLTKNIERSAIWLADMLRNSDSEVRPANVFVQMAGGASASARNAFAESLLEVLHGKDADAVRPLKCLDEGVAGYVFDMVPLELAQGSQARPLDPSTTTALLRASLGPLPSWKPRLATSVRGPHDMLRLVRDVGIDLFDMKWAQRAADIGVALDFTFPVPKISSDYQSTRRRDLGHNLYDTIYREDFTSFTYDPALQLSGTCGCAACSPTSVPRSEVIQHSSVDGSAAEIVSKSSPYTKAFVHHLLHTHEMSAHSLLAMHNITIMDSFFAGIRTIIAQNDASLFASEMEKFFEVYAEDTDEGKMQDMHLNIFEVAAKAWEEVELLRGKGRLARENEREKAESAAVANALLKQEMEEKGIENASPEDADLAGEFTTAS